MFVIIAHQRFARALAILFPIPQASRDLLLQIEMEDVRRALGEVMQVGAQSEEEIVGHFDSALVRFA